MSGRAPGIQITAAPDRRRGGFGPVDPSTGSVIASLLGAAAGQMSAKALASAAPAKTGAQSPRIGSLRTYSSFSVRKTCRTPR